MSNTCKRLVAVLALSLSLYPFGGGPAAQAEYRIGSADVLQISVWDNKDLDQVVFVRPDGKISLPLLGEVQAAGRTVAELSAALSELYGKTVKGAQVTVTMREIHSRSAFFVGGVGKPGPLQLAQELTLLQALSLVGGLLPAADMESAYVLRGDKQIPVDFVKLIQKGDIRQNIRLQPGDTIVVPIAEVVFVQGEVKNPGPVKFTKDLTMLSLIAQAGGFTPLAAPKRVNVIRVNGEKKDSIRVNVNEIMSESARDVPLKPNDIVIVPQRLF